MSAPEVWEVAPEVVRITKHGLDEINEQGVDASKY